MPDNVQVTSPGPRRYCSRSSAQCIKLKSDRNDSLRIVEEQPNGRQTSKSKKRTLHIFPHDPGILLLSMVSQCSGRLQNSPTDQVLIFLGGFVLLRPSLKSSSKKRHRPPQSRIGENKYRKLQRKSQREPSKTCQLDTVGFFCPFRYVFFSFRKSPSRRLLPHCSFSHI